MQRHFNDGPCVRLPGRLPAIPGSDPKPSAGDRSGGGADEVDGAGSTRQLRPAQLKIAHRAPDAAVPEQQLNRTQVGAELEQMHGERMAVSSVARHQPVRRGTDLGV